MNSQVEADNEWKRSGDKIQDLFHLYESSSLYDCSFKVGSVATGQKVFKCHKLILATASPVFERMLCGLFKEASMGADEEIVLNTVTPSAFHSALRFIYGNKTDFEDVLTATATFLFAHEMLLFSLIEAVEEYLRSKAAPENIFAIYDAFQLTDHKAGLEWSWEVIGRNTSEALKSKFWEEVSAATVNALLSAPELTVENETEIFEALSTWGHKQARKITDGEPSFYKVRKVLQEQLKLVKFFTMSSEEFAQLDLTSKTLSVKEKHCIYRSLALQSPQYLPEGYSAGGRIFLSPKEFIFSLSMEEYNGTFSSPSYATFTFKVSQRAYLVGLQVHENMGVVNYFQLFNEEMTKYIGHGHSRAKCDFEGKDHYAVLKNSILEPNKSYSITFALKWEIIKRMGYVKACTLENGNLTIELPTQHSVHVTSLVFELVL